MTTSSFSRDFRTLLGSTALATIGITLIAGVAPSFGANINWTGQSSSVWQDGGNWNGGVPGSTDNAIIDKTAPNAAVLSSGTGNSDGAYIGSFYSGTLTISSGAKLITQTLGMVGSGPGATGAVTVTGAGSSWQGTPAGSLVIGNFGTGTLNLTAGGVAGAGTVVIAGDIRGTGTVVVDGAGSGLSARDSLDVAAGGTGTLTITNGGKVMALDIVGGTTTIADNAGSKGKVTVDGSGSLLETSGLTIGNFGQASLAVTHGAQVLVDGIGSTGIGLGVNAGSTATVAIDGSGSLLRTIANMGVGGAGTATISVTNGGALQVQGSVGLSGLMIPGGIGSGSITASGAGTTLQFGSTATSLFDVGSYGTATVSLSAGATASVTGLLVAGDTVGAVGTVTVSGAGSAMAVNPVAGTGGATTIGNYGSGSLVVSSGATMTMNALSVGAQTHGSGTVTVTGSGASLSAVSGSIGQAGTGALNVLAGANAAFSGLLTLGAVAGAWGALSVDGSGSHVGAGVTTIGQSGSGTATVSNGGSMSVTDLYVNGTNSTLTVTGSGSSFTATGNRGANIGTGFSSNGTMTVSDGAIANVRDIYIGYSGSGTLTVQGTGSQLNVDPASTFTVGHFGTSTGRAVISGGGAVADATAIVAAQTNSIGSVKVDGAGSSWTTSGTLTIAGAGFGSALVTNGATLSAGNIAIAQTGGSLGVLYIGSWDTTPGEAGTVKTSGITFGVGNGFITFNHTSSAYTFDSSISGTGQLTQLAGHTILTGSDGGFSGVVEVDGGTLSVNTNLVGGAATVGIQGTLGGSGTIGSLAVIAGGTVAPGNSIGTLSVAGNASFAAGSFYQVQLDAHGHSDLLAVGGIATLNGGTVQAMAQPGYYVGANRYTILTSTGGVTGTFAGVTSDTAFLTPSLSYDANDVYLTMTRNVATFGSVGVTRNQVATGTAVDITGSGNPLWNAVVGMNAAQARTAFDQLSGDIHASTRSALIEDSRLVRDAAMDRIRDAFSELGLPGNPAMAYASLDQTPARRDAPVAIWGRLIGSWGATASDGNAAALSRDTKGIVTGADALVAEGVRLGVLAGYSRTSLRSEADNSTAGSDDYHVGAYAGWQRGALGLRTGAAYSWHDIDTTRTIALPGFFGRAASGSQAQTAQVFGEFAYRFDVAPRSAIEPFIAAAWVGVHGDGFNETGSVAALTGASGDTGVTFSTLGLRGSSQFAAGDAMVTLKGALGWRHAFGDVTPNVAVAFAGGTPFMVAGVPIARDAAALDAGLSVALTRNATIGIAYSGQVAKGAHDNGVKADFTWRF